MSSRTATFALLALLFSLSGCTILNSIDVCERDMPPEHVINVRTEGDQRVNGLTPVAALPGGGAFVAFTSDVSGADEDTEIRGTLLDVDGQRLPTCEKPQEYTFAEPGTEAAVNLASGASVAAPTNGTGAGLIAFIRATADDQDFSGFRGEIWGETFNEFGCSATAGGPFRIDEDDDKFTDLPATVSVGQDLFAVIWVEYRSGSDTRLRGRIIDVSGLIVRFLPTVAPVTEARTDGEAVDLLPTGPILQGVSAAPMDDGLFAVAWGELTSGGDLSTHLMVLNDRFEFELGPVIVDDGREGRGVADTNEMSVAYDGQRFFVAWPALDEQNHTRIYARFVDERGKFPGSESEADGKVFRLGQTADAEQGRVSITAQPGGGFVAAWEEASEHGGEDDSGLGLRLAVFDESLKRSFTNPACGTDDFLLNQATQGDQEGVGLTTFPDGSLVAVWTDRGSNDINQRGTASVRSVVLTPFDLFPIE